MSKKIEKITLREEFTVCPSCRYGGGFHTIFKRLPEEIKMNLVCPSCNEEFDLNFTITVSDNKTGD